MKELLHKRKAKDSMARDTRKVKEKKKKSYMIISEKRLNLLFFAF